MMFRTLSDRTTVQEMSANAAEIRSGEATFIFANILQREGQSSVFPLDNSNLPKCSLSDDSQQSEMIEVHCGEKSRLASDFKGTILGNCQLLVLQL